MKVWLAGDGLGLAQLEEIAFGDGPVEVAAAAWDRVGHAADYLQRAAGSGRLHYGINTGFGAFADLEVGPAEATTLQENLLVSHACGVGEPLPTAVVRVAMALRIDTLLHGNSGISPGPLRLMVEMLNRRIHPVVPCQGSVGASGDLAPLSHMALPILGLGKVEVDGHHRAAAEVLAAHGLRPLRLTWKEGLALNNGTQVTTALGVVGLLRAMGLAAAADAAAALSLEAICGRASAFDARVHALRPHPGQTEVAARVRALTQGSQLVGIDCTRVPGKRVLPQDSYSLRCVPQVHGAARDVLAQVQEVLLREVASVTDNPLIFPDDDEILSGGNFHAQPVAFALDHLKLAVATLGNISERRTAKLLDRSQSDGLPAFLIDRPGINSGLMIPQYVAAALASENKTLAHPASVDTIPTSANTEDHVSMGPIAGRHALMMIENTRRILAVELLTAAQGVDLRLRQLGVGPEALGVGTRRLRERIRAVVPFADGDRDFGRDIEALDALLAARHPRLEPPALAGIPELP